MFYSFIIIKMEVNLLANGKRDRRFRPYIQDEELNTHFQLYTPSEYVPVGLYSQAGQPSERSWLYEWRKYPSHIPVQVVDTNGRLHSIIPNSQTTPRYASYSSVSRHPMTMYGN